MTTETALIARGVNPGTAARLAAEYPAEQIRTHVDALDWLLANDRDHRPRNPGRVPGPIDSRRVRDSRVDRCERANALADGSDRKRRQTSLTTGSRRREESDARRDEVQDAISSDSILTSDAASKQRGPAFG